MRSRSQPATLRTPLAKTAIMSIEITRKYKICAIVLFFLSHTAEAQQPFQTVSTVNASTIAGRPVQLDASDKLLPWPMPDNTGYSYSSHFLTQWSILWDQYNRQRYHYFFCCFDFDRTSFEMQPDYHWANSTAYLRAM